MEKYRMLSKKGEGTFSEVIKCQNIKDGTYWALKKLKQTFKSSEELKEIREIQALRYLSNSPHILKLHEVIFEKRTGNLNLIFELMDMNLYEFIKTQRTYFKNEKIASLTYQMLKAIEHMHKHGYFHRDLKPENILIKGDLLKIGDFGSSRRINTRQPYTEYISTRWYRAPECLLTDGFYSYPMDVWSAGCIMFEIITFYPLFPGANELDQIDKIHDIFGTPEQNLLEKLVKKSRNLVRYNFRMKKGTGFTRFMPSNNYNPLAADLIKTLCTYDPEVRISAHKALKHSFFDILKEKNENNNKENEVQNTAKENEEHNSLVKKLSDIKHEDLDKNANSSKKIKGKKKITKNSVSLSTLSHHTDSNNNQISYQYINFPTKKNYLQNSNVNFPRLSLSNNELSAPSSVKSLLTKSNSIHNTDSSAQNNLPQIHQTAGYVDDKVTRKF